MPLDLLTLLNAVFESTADGILVVDNEGKLIRSNRKFQEMWRIPDSLIETGDDEELVSVVLDQVLDPAQFLSRVQSLYQDHDAISDDTISFKDGRIFTRHSRPLKSGNAKVGRLWVFRDMTNEMKSEEVFSAIAELSPDIISIISAAAAW